MIMSDDSPSDELIGEAVKLALDRTAEGGCPYKILEGG
jgi:hypothetical protein